RAVAPRLAAVVLRLLAKNAEDRPQDTSEVLAALAEHDEHGAAPQQFRLPQKLYGRETASAELIAGFQRAAAGACVFALVAGYAGVGKSSLVLELHRPLTASRGFFASGKFDQYNRGVPFAAVITAAATLLQHVLTLGAREIDGWRERIAHAVGGALPVLAQIVPDVQAIVGPQPEPPPLPTTEAQQRTQSTLQRFIGVFAAEEHPLVLFLDDLQWSDGATMRLLEALVTDPGAHHLLLLAAYRDHELDPGHRLAALLAELRNGAAPPLEIRLGPLTTDDVAALLRDTLATPNVDDLARELVHRTHGNPLFIREFLRFLHRESLLRHDEARNAWTWDLTSVDAARIPDSVAALLGDELRRLPQGSQEVLQLASCLGTRFDAGTLALVHGDDVAALARLLQPAIDLDLIIPLHPSYRLLAHAEAAELELSVPLRFLHDRVRQAAYALIPADERPARHALVGRRLLARARAEDQLHEALFDVVSHLNEATALLDADELDDLAALDLAAARRAKASAAYDTALILLQAGITALGPDAWDRRRDLSFALCSEQAECEYLSGAPDRALERLEQIEPHAQDSVQRLQLADLRVVLYASMGDTRGALQAGLAGLAAAGVEIPGDDAACRAEVAAELARIEADLARAPLDALVEAPPLADPKIRGVLKLLADMLAPANMTRPDLYALINTKQIRLSIEHGHTDISAYTYVVYGYFLATVLRQYAQADLFGRFALQLNDRLGNSALRCRLRFVFATYAHFTRPLRGVLAEFVGAQDDGRESGDHIYRASACSHVLISRIGLGDPLSEVAEQADRFIALMQRMRVASSAAAQTVSRQFTAALQGHTRAAYSLDDDGFDEATFIVRAERGGLTFALRWYATVKLQLCLLFDRQADARALLDRFAGAIASNFAFYFTTEFAFYAALMLLRLAGEADPAERPALLAAHAPYADALAGWAAACPDDHANNYAHKAALVR
ncbi:MAG TPA: AAA family ATPase, partial [Nannocystis sp.]